MKEEAVEAHPLQWPEGRPRTRWRRQAQFKITLGLARDCLMDEIRRLGGKHAVLSTNLKVRLDGLPYASQRTPDDPGAAVYFTYDGQQVCFACDRWDRIEHNIQAIRKTIEALRGIARWGTGDMVKAAFQGFTALPPPRPNDWRAVLGVPPDCCRRDVAWEAYRRRRSECHPDKGGDAEEFRKVQLAWEAAQESIGGGD